MFYNTPHRADFSVWRIRKSFVVMSEVAPTHHLFKNIFTFFLVGIANQALVFKQKSILHYPHHASCKANHPELLKVSKNIFFMLSLRSLENKIVIQKLPHTNTLIEEMAIDMQKDIEKIESDRRSYQPTAFGKHFLLVNLEPFLQAFVLAQVQQDFRDIVHFHFNPFESIEVQVFVVPLRIRISQGVRVFNGSFPSAVDKYVYVSRLAQG